MTARFHLAQVNIGRARGDDRSCHGQVRGQPAGDQRAADQTPGFVWRLQTEDGDATAVHAPAPRMVRALRAGLRSAFAFSFRDAFGPDGVPLTQEGVARDDSCPAP
jgi:hypothetical protein